MSTTRKFDRLLRKLPQPAREVAAHAVAHPLEPQYAIKKLRPFRRLATNSWRLKILNQQYRAIGQKTKAGYEWYWVGTHEKYNTMVGK